MLLHADLSVNLCLTGQSDVRAKTKARFDEVLKRYTNPPSEKKKAKQIDEQSQEVIVVSNSERNLYLIKKNAIDRRSFTVYRTPLSLI